jgi:hypothetical protein
MNADALAHEACECHHVLSDLRRHLFDGSAGEQGTQRAAV